MPDHGDETTCSRFQRCGKHTRGSGWYSFDRGGMHFIGVVDVLHSRFGGLETLGSEQLKWLEADVKGLPESTPVVVFTDIRWSPTDSVWGWGTPEGVSAFTCLERFESVFVLGGQIH